MPVLPSNFYLHNLSSYDNIYVNREESFHQWKEASRFFICYTMNGSIPPQNFDPFFNGMVIEVGRAQVWVEFIETGSKFRTFAR
jgi:hypothetical protein